MSSDFFIPDIIEPIPGTCWICGEPEEKGHRVCKDCNNMTCDRCALPLVAGTAIEPEMCCPLHGVREDGTQETFSDGAKQIHMECLTEREKHYYDRA